MKTTKQFCIAVLALLFGLIQQSAMAQKSDKPRNFKEGDIVINAGIGFFSSIGYYGSDLSRTPVISLTGEYGVTKLGPGTLGVGLALGYQGAHTTDYAGPYYYKYKWTTTLFGIRGVYHPDFLNTDKYDVYGALQLSYDHFSSGFDSNDPYVGRYYYSGSISSYFRPYLLVGGRYYFSKSFGVYAEVGYDIAVTKIGVSIKL